VQLRDVKGRSLSRWRDRHPDRIEALKAKLAKNEEE
jgi:hypothetical protein